MSAPHRLLLPPPCHATAIFQRRRSAAIPMLFACCLLVPMLIILALLRLIQRHQTIYAENNANTSIGTVQFLLGIDRCPYRYWHCRGGVNFQYGHLSSARTSNGNSVMEFIFNTGTCQVPVPVLALPRWSSFPGRALGKCLYQYWQTSEFYCTLEKLR